MNNEIRIDLRNRSFNCRVTFDDQGNPCIGAVLGFFTVDSDCYDIKPVDNTTIVHIAKRLGIKKSTKTLSVTRKLQKEWAKEAGQQELPFNSVA